MQIVVAQIRCVGIARHSVDVVRPHDLERQTVIKPPAERETADEAQVHAAATAKERNDAVTLDLAGRSTHRFSALQTRDPGRYSRIPRSGDFAVAVGRAAFGFEEKLAL